MSDEIKDRIEAAEALGWKRFIGASITDENGHRSRIDGWLDPCGQFRPVSLGGDLPIPDPFEDANADYEVLKLMRRSAGEFGGKMSKKQLWLYETGDNARNFLRWRRNETRINVNEARTKTQI